MPNIDQLDTSVLFLISVVLLFTATQIVILVLNHLQSRKYGTVLLGTLVTPLCTGFPNLIVGLFGQERLQGDLVLQLNIGNNLANTSLVAGLLLFAAGPLRVRPGKGKSKKAKRANLDQNLAFIFLWAGTIALFVLAIDGAVSRTDGFGLVCIYICYQLISIRRRKIPKKQHLRFIGIGLILGLLAVSAFLIERSLLVLGVALERVGHLFPGNQLGLFLGLLMVIPESFLLLRLAFKEGSLGLSGLVGDCLVSIPLVVGLTAIFTPFKTQIFHFSFNESTITYSCLAATMLAITILSLSTKPVPRKVGILFMTLYASVWGLTTYWG